MSDDGGLRQRVFADRASSVRHLCLSAPGQFSMPLAVDRMAARNLSAKPLGAKAKP
jgi:hypothetical protein